MKRHAYLILAHKNPGQFRKLIALLDDPRNDIFVHVDRKATFRPEDWTRTCRHSGLYFLDRRIRVNWGGVSIMRCELALLEAAAARGRYDYYHLLSGMDLPIKDQDTIHAFFDEHSGAEFINFWEMKEDTGDRFHYYTLFPEGARNFLTHFLNDTFKSLQKAVGHSINKDVDFRSASQWFSITDELARYVISKKDWLEKVFRHTCLCDEIFLATLVWNSPFREKVYPGDMRFIDWSGNGRHPRTFRMEDWDRLMSSPQFWARKFDESIDSGIIDRIYGHLSHESARRLFLIAGYDTLGQVGPALAGYVRELSEYGDTVVVMDSHADTSELEKLSPYTLYREAVRHGEYDFGSYKRAFQWAREHLDLNSYDTLYLVNDSVYGPLLPLREYLERMEALDCGASAMVLNPHRGTPHLQSWLIGLRPEVFLSEWFTAFLMNVMPLESKEEVCVRYETGLTALLAGHGIRYGALYRLSGKAVYNKVKAMWQKGIPFIKKSSFTRHGGSLGRQIRYVLQHAEPSRADAVKADACRVFGKEYTEHLLNGSAPDMAARYLKYLYKKIK